MRIAICGPPGSGKTTVCALVANHFGYDYVLVGQVFRQMAIERKMDLESFGRLAEENETIDRELDERMLAIALSRGDIVMEGRLTGALLKSRKIPVFAVFINAEEQVRAERIARRESREVESVLREMQSRERSEKKRYFAYYGINPYNESIYDLRVDSTSQSAESVAEAIVDKIRKAMDEDARQVKGKR